MAIQIDPEKIAAISLDDLRLLAELVDEVAVTTETTSRHRLCNRVNSHLHQLFMGTRVAIMVDQRFEAMRNDI